MFRISELNGVIQCFQSPTSHPQFVSQLLGQIKELRMFLNEFILKTEAFQIQMMDVRANLHLLLKWFLFSMRTAQLGSEKKTLIQDSKLKGTDVEKLVQFLRCSCTAPPPASSSSSVFTMSIDQMLFGGSTMQTNDEHNDNDRSQKSLDMQLQDIIKTWTKVLLTLHPSFDNNDERVREPGSNIFENQERVTVLPLFFCPPSAESNKDIHTELQPIRCRWNNSILMGSIMVSPTQTFIFYVNRASEMKVISIDLIVVRVYVHEKYPPNNPNGNSNP